MVEARLVDGVKNTHTHHRQPIIGSVPSLKKKMNSSKPYIYEHLPNRGKVQNVYLVGGNIGCRDKNSSGD